MTIYRAKTYEKIKPKYLYVKTHNKTGLKYLGQTNRDPLTYKGSGKRWTNHINKHGYDVSTEILVKCYTNAALKSWGIFYSKLWSVVESNKWANLRPEIGDGGFGTEPGERGRATQKILRESDQDWVEMNNKAVSQGVQRFYDEGGKGSFTGKKHKSQYYTKLKKTHDEIKHQQGEKNSQHGTMWINNSEHNTKWSIDSIPVGWMAGRVMNLPSLPKDEKKKLLSQFAVDK